MSTVAHSSFSIFNSKDRAGHGSLYGICNTQRDVGSVRLNILIRSINSASGLPGSLGVKIEISNLLALVFGSVHRVHDPTFSQPLHWLSHGKVATFPLMSSFRQRV